MAGFRRKVVRPKNQIAIAQCRDSVNIGRKHLVSTERAVANQCEQLNDRVDEASVPVESVSEPLVRFEESQSFC